ncbi:hypothetical protein [Flavobacterium sp.]|uniref:hypothetical protein n=1 Tax=Flavobacterium sp. TaxID=239 RepID=UPI002ED8A879
MQNLEDLFHSFETGIRSIKATKPKEYLNSLGLDYAELRIGFNSGQFHHNKDQQFKDRFEALGVLKKSDAGVQKSTMTAYTVFGRYGVVFPLFDKENTIVNYFTVRFGLNSPVEDYLNADGVYPAYPHALTKRLYVVPTVIDAASLIQSKALENKDAVLALHNGQLLPQHMEAIEQLQELEEIIIIKR